MVVLVTRHNPPDRASTGLYDPIMKWGNANKIRPEPRM